jgi:copper chaperone CopZ
MTLACSPTETTSGVKVGGSAITDSTFSQVALEVPTIWCSTCQPRVEASAKSVAGVKDVKFDGQTVVVAYDPAQTTPDAIIRAIERGGDRVTRATKL